MYCFSDARPPSSVSTRLHCNGPPPPAPNQLSLSLDKVRPVSADDDTQPEIVAGPEETTQFPLPFLKDMEELETGVITNVKYMFFFVFSLIYMVS
jgi:hypothetical protein